MSMRNACPAALLVCAASFALIASGCATKVEEEPSQPKKTISSPPGYVDRHFFHKTSFQNVLFMKGKSDLPPQSLYVLDTVVAEMKVHKQDELTIVGHTSEEGSAEYNLQLGEQRALKAKAYLVEHGIDAGRIMTVSKGESEPAVPPDTENDRKLNRRVTFMRKAIGD